MTPVQTPLLTHAGPCAKERRLHLAVSGLSLSRRATGIGRYVRSLLQGYLATFPEDELTLALPTDVDDANSFDTHPNVRCTRVPHRIGHTRSRLLWELSALRHWTRAVAPDVLFQPDFVLPWRRLPCPVAVTIHDLAFRRVLGSKSRAMRVYLHTAVRRAVRRANALIVHTQAVGNELITEYGAEPSRIGVVEPPIDPPPSTPPGAEALAWRDGITGGRPYFLHVSNFDLRKNVDRLLEAFRTHRAAGHDELLILAGEGARRAHLQDRTRTLGLADRVTFTGWIDDDHREALYQGARAFLFPSLLEGYGLPVVEAMARGVPVVTSGGGALEEAAASAALLVDPLDGDSIARAFAMLDSETRRKDLAARGLERATRTSPERSARRLREFLTEIARQDDKRC